MNERKFLKGFEQSEHKQELIEETAVLMEEFAIEQEISINELSKDMIEQLAEGLVERGLGETRRYQKRHATDKSWTEELGTATDGEQNE
jgi:hypothetical protein